jgi:ribosome-associated protein
MKENLVNELTKFLDDKKAEDIINFDVKESSPFFENIIIATAMNMRQLGSLSEQVEKFFEDNNVAVHNIEGKKESGWIIIDAYDIVVHLFSIEERQRVKIEEILEKGR